MVVSKSFDSVPWLRDEPGTRDMCVLEAPKEAGVYIAVLDIDMLRDHRSNDIIDVFSRIQIEKLILSYMPTMLLVEHDVRFQEKIATNIIRL